MQENYKPIGDFIRVVNQRNKDLSVKQLIGLSIDKCYIPSVANVIGTDLSTYKIIKRKQFACSLMQVSRDEKIPIACMTEYDEAIMSPAYVIFEIIDESLLLPEYLDMWVMRAEFDREASFLAVGGVRGSLAWDDFCRMKLPVPTIEEQNRVVKAYKTITERIELKKRINDNLEATAQAVFQELFGSYYGDADLPEGWRFDKLENLCTIKGGKRLPADCELLDTPTNHPYIRVRDVGNGRFVCLTNQFQYIDDETHSAISRYIVNEGDVVISIVGTIGLIGKVHRSLDKANLTENCVKLTDVHSITSDYLYYTLCYKK